MKPSSHYKDILINLTLRNLNIKYKESVLGFFWAFLNPLLTMCILSFVFSKIMRIDIDNYPLFLLSAILPWIFFSTSLLEATESVVTNANLVKKVYFPREVLPMALVLSNFINLIFAFMVFIPIFLVFSGKITLALVFLPIVFIIHLGFTIGLALFLSCANVYLRDTSHLLTIALMLWFYITPIFYPLSMVPARFHDIYMLNPMVHIISMYRDVLIGGKFPMFLSIFISIASAVVALFIGYAIFKRYQAGFAKEI